jgi:hypothetical protein
MTASVYRKGRTWGPTPRFRSRAGADQYGQPFPVPDANWTASGGTIDETGRFTAVAGVLEATTDGRIAPKQGPDKPQDQQQGLLRWSGAVLPQKWMDFYTKVVRRFATMPGLKLTVGFEVPVPPGQAKWKADETRTALRDLGLPDDVG